MLTGTFRLTLEARFQAVYKRQCDIIGHFNLCDVNDIALECING
jgi:hypothetical protein